MKRLRGFFLLGVLVISFLSGGALQGLAKPSKTQNVVLVTLDGLRWQELFYGADEQLINKESGGVANVAGLKAKYWRDTPEERRLALLPFFWKVLAKQGQIFGNVRKGSVVKVTNGMNFSYPGYNEILTGVPDPRINSNEKRPNPNLNVLEWLHQRPRYRDRVAAFCSWDVFPYILNRERSGLYVNAGPEPVLISPSTERLDLLNHLVSETPALWEGVRYDAFTFYSALEYLKIRKPKVLYIAFDETDERAHEGRYDLYLDTAHRIDTYLEQLWKTLQSLSQYRGKTTLILTTDHGRGDTPADWRNHGAQVKGAEYIWIALLGPDIPPLGERSNTPPLTQSQIAGTLADLLGEDFCSAVPQAGKPLSRGERNPLSRR